LVESKVREKSFFCYLIFSLLSNRWTNLSFLEFLGVLWSRLSYQSFPKIVQIEEHSSN
jgi:hypothetical protein